MNLPSEIDTLIDIVMKQKDFNTCRQNGEIIIEDDSSALDEIMSVLEMGL